MTIYDWPQSVIPSDQLFRVPGQATQGGFTSGGSRIMSPEVGGRAVVEWTFGTQKEWTNASRLYSWLISKVSNGAIFRLPIWRSKQLVSIADLGLVVPPGYETTGIPWEGDTLWDDDTGWLFEPGVFTTSSALEGSTVLVVDMGEFLPALWHGHVIGLAGRAYLVDDIEYEGQIATITVTPPLRSGVVVGDFVTFRPVMYGTCIDPDNFKSLFDRGIWIRPGSVQFAEAII